MTIDNRIALLEELGHFLRAGGDEELQATIRKACVENGWFTEESVGEALSSIAVKMLDSGALSAWVNSYTPVHNSRNIGLVMAGNIPLVGFHDWLCVFITGHRAVVKLSEKDRHLLPFLVKHMGTWDKESWAYTEFLMEGEPLRGFDAVIATGSNNTARYFEAYFGKYPHLIRRNRNSVAVLSGRETTAELLALGHDIFSFFGLGCRNVSKLYVPQGYQFDELLEVLHEYKDIVHHHKYKNNFDYNLTLYLLNNLPHLHNGCMILREDPALASRIACVHYEYYKDIAKLRQTLMLHNNEIQCVVGGVPLEGIAVLPFGTSQSPGLTDYPDGVDVMAFLRQLEVEKND